LGTQGEKRKKKPKHFRKKGGAYFLGGGTRGKGFVPKNGRDAAGKSSEREKQPHLTTGAKKKIPTEKKEPSRGGLVIAKFHEKGRRPTLAPIDWPRQIRGVGKGGGKGN